MERYANINGNSGVAAYKAGPDFIELKFHDRPETYRYTYKTAGKANVETMKRLALAGRGLSTFVSQTVRDKFERTPWR